MAIWIVLLPLAVALAVAVVVSLLTGRRVAPSMATADIGPTDGGQNSTAAVARTELRTTAWRLAGLVVGILAALALAMGPPNWLGLGVALAAPAFALCLLAGVIVGEITGTAPASATRTAAIEVRAARLFLPRAMTWWVVALTVGLTAFLAVTSLFAAADDMGRAGRSLTVICGTDRSGAAGPWPGAYYSLPIGTAVLVGLSAAALAARAVARRRRPQPDEAARTADDRVRRASARAITAACGVLTAAPLAGSALFAGWALLRIDCAPPLLHLAGWASITLAALAASGTCYFAAAVILPDRRAAR